MKLRTPRLLAPLLALASSLLIAAPAVAQEGTIKIIVGFPAGATSDATGVVNDPALEKRLVEMGVEPTGYGPDRLAKILKEDYDRWGPVIEESGFKPGQ